MSYRDGSVTITQGSSVLLGTGVNWINQRAGWWVWVRGDERPNEIDQVISSTQLRLAQPIEAASASGVEYAIIPTQGLNPRLLEKFDELDVVFRDAKASWDAVFSDFQRTVFTVWQEQPGNEARSFNDFLSDLPEGPRGKTAIAARVSARLVNLPPDPQVFLGFDRDAYISGDEVGEIEDALTFSRASEAFSATRNALSRVIAGEPETVATPFTGIRQGIRIHGGQTNMISEPYDLTLPYWQKNTGVNVISTAAGGPIDNGLFSTLLNYADSANTRLFTSALTALPNTHYVAACYMRAANAADVGKQVLLQLKSGPTGAAVGETQRCTLTANWVRYWVSVETAADNDSIIAAFFGTSVNPADGVDIAGLHLLAGRNHPDTFVETARAPDELSLSDVSVLQGEAFTISVAGVAPFNTVLGLPNQTIFNASGAGSLRVWGYRSAQTGAVAVVLTNSIGTTVLQPGTLTPGIPFRLTVAADGSTARANLNGAPSDSDSIAELPAITDLQIGHRPSGEHFDGVISEVVAWPRALSGQAMRNIFWEAN